eukprot:Gregarina_sp_Poly_1__3586@NODE_204_length_11513_cov_91_076009_g182_i0_p4_GENE_NODE_204_length_11513_cov_91_076009_g182_i0NODE_204_length_11513_cov_91_076009_g182_i0_p4_ORF_typecomplete_len240_score25_02Pkinase/PF00069_25/0_039_NODE_204_length_11513_cov_91_076009_g182_i072547973
MVQVYLVSENHLCLGCSCKIHFRGYPFSSVSEEGRHLLAWMTQKDPELRCSAASALQHPWFHTESLLPGPATLDNSPMCLIRLPRSLLAPKQVAYVTGISPPTAMDEVVAEQSAPTPPPETDYFEASGGQIWPFPQTHLALTRVCRHNSRSADSAATCKLLRLPSAFTHSNVCALVRGSQPSPAPVTTNFVSNKSSPSLDSQVLLCSITCENLLGHATPEPKPVEEASNTRRATVWLPH